MANKELIVVNVCRETGRIMLRSVLLLLGAVGTSLALYSKGDAVVDLTPSNFDKEVIL